jgi:RNA polymerase sigma-70 factor (ECF subfamily)
MRDLYNEESFAGRAAERNSANDVIAEQVAIGGEQTTEFRRCIDRLSKREQHLIQQAFYADCTYSELAERLGLPCATIVSEIRGGLIRLKRDVGVTD